MHPIPQFPTKLNGSFWGIVVYFNPAGYKNKIENYRIFKESAQSQGLNILAVELAFGDTPFELSNNDAPILIQLRGGRHNIMWQKESLINIGLKNLPSDCDKVAWIDCDIIFKNDYWIQETSDLLEKYMVVQPFSLVARLSRGVYDLNDEQIKKLPVGRSQGQRFYSFAYAFNVLKNTEGHTGFVWASRREIIDKHLLYNRLIIGGADRAIAYLLYGTPRNIRQLKCSYNSKTFKHFMQWANYAREDIRGSIAYANGTLMHLWHGDKEERMHVLRDSVIFKLLDFDPVKDVKLSSTGILEWASDDPNLHKAVEKYFRLRNEDGNSKPPKLMAILRKVFNIIFFFPFAERLAMYLFVKLFTLAGFVKRIVRL